MYIIKLLVILLINIVYNKIPPFKFDFNINIILYFIFFYHKIIVLVFDKLYLNFYKNC